MNNTHSQFSLHFSCLQLNLLVWLQYQEHVNYTIIPHLLLVRLCSEGMFSKYGSYGIQQPCRCWIGGIGLACAGGSWGGVGVGCAGGSSGGIGLWCSAGSSRRHLWGWLRHHCVGLPAPLYFLNLKNDGAAVSLPSRGFPAGSSGGSDLARIPRHHFIT
jgi:hypothetical protein